MFPLSSEAFIAEQVSALRRYRPLLLMRSKRGTVRLEHFALSEARGGPLRAAAFAAMHLPGLFTGGDRLRDLRLLHAHFGPDGVCMLPLARRLRIPLIVTFHGGDATIAPRARLRTGKLYNLHYALRERSLREEAALFLAVSDFLRGRLVERGYPAGKVIRHYIGVDTDCFRPLGRSCAEPYILCVGRHTAVKGLDVLLRAFARLAGRHRGVSLVQVGAGPLTARLRALADALGIGSRVQFLGALPHERVVGLMQRARLFALPSQTAAGGESEALGVVFNEASACGLPIVATRHGGIQEAVLDGETGFLVAERDDAAFAEKLDLLLSDGGLAERLGKRGREHVCELFDLRRQTSALERLYDEVLQR